MKKSYIFISPSDPIGCVILEWDYVPTVFEGKRNNGNIKWAWRCGSEDTQRRRAAGCWLLLRAELKQTRRPDDECMESGSLWTETEDNYWGKGVIFSLKLVEKQDTNIHCIKQYCWMFPTLPSANWIFLIYLWIFVEIPNIICGFSLHSAMLHKLANKPH